MQPPPLPVTVVCPAISSHIACYGTTAGLEPEPCSKYTLGTTGSGLHAGVLDRQNCLSATCTHIDFAPASQNLHVLTTR